VCHHRVFSLIKSFGSNNIFQNEIMLTDVGWNLAKIFPSNKVKTCASDNTKP